MASLQTPTSSSVSQQQGLLVAMHNEAFVPTRNVTQKGSLTSDQAEKVRAWQSAAATGILFENHHKPTPTGPSDGSEKIGAAKGPSLDSEWGDNLILLDDEWGDNLILLDSEWRDNLILL